MKTASLLLLRVATGLLMVTWGVDKLINPAHGAAVAERFYLGVLASESVMPVLGSLQIVLGLLVVAGLLRRFAYPALALITGATLLGVWRSILDPLGIVLERTNLLFYPSIIVFAGVLVLMAFRQDDVWALDRR
jgi:putative oxidoreductase